MSGKLPAVLLYVAEYLADTRGLTNEQKGFYVDLLCYMHNSPRRGHLMQPSGKPYPNAQLAKMTGCTAIEASRLLQELIDAAVISATTEGIPYSRRMVRDEHKRQLCKEAGKKGGNPTLKGGLNGTTKGGLKPSFEDETSSVWGLGESGERGLSPGSAITQIHLDRAQSVLRLYPLNAKMHGRAIQSTMMDVNALAAKVARDSSYPWEEHARLMHHNQSPPDARRWVESLPDRFALDRLRQASQSAPSVPKPKTLRPIP